MGTLKMYLPKWMGVTWAVWAVFFMIWCVAIAVMITVFLYNILPSLTSSIPIIAYRQGSVGIIAIGQVAIGFITIGQLTVGVISIGQVGVGLLFAVGMAVGGFGITVAQMHISGWNLIGQCGIALFKSHFSVISINLLGPFVQSDTNLLTVCCRSSWEHTITDGSAPTPAWEGDGIEMKANPPRPVTMQV